MKNSRIIYLILIFAAILRIWNLNAGDPISDEGTNAFRSLGMMDFDAAEAQSTPWEWSDPLVPWWMHLSFHDHPLLTFYAEHFSFYVFGVSDFAYRFPAAIFGILSIYFIYIFGRKLFSDRVGLLAASILTVTVNHVYVSRIGLQESYVIFFILLTAHIFWSALEDRRLFIFWGVLVGLGLLAKYTTFVAVIACLFYAVLKRRDIFLMRDFYVAIFIAIMIFSPSIIYNVALYKTFGHFDFQISHILGQNPVIWSVAPGKEIGLLSDRLVNLPINIWKTYSWAFLFLFVIFAPIILLRVIFRRKYMDDRSGRSILFLFIITISITILFLKIGTAYRFLTMLAPAMAIWIALGMDWAYKKILTKNTYTRSFFLIIGFTVFLMFEIFYSLNSQVWNYPIGMMPWMYSNVRYENYNWGYNELNDFLNKEFGDLAPALSFDAKYDFLNKLKDDGIARAVVSGKKTTPTLILYEGNFEFAPKLWYLDRLQIYGGWPIMSWRNYMRELEEKGQNYFVDLGFREFYLIFMNNIATDKVFNDFVSDKQSMPILNKRGEEAFRVYRF